MALLPSAILFRQEVTTTPWQLVAAGAAVGMLNGMIGLGGAEFRLPLLIGLFGFIALQAVILNKAMSLMVVLTALPARLAAVPLSTLAPQWPVMTLPPARRRRRAYRTVCRLAEYSLTRASSPGNW